MRHHTHARGTHTRARIFTRPYAKSGRVEGVFTAVEVFQNGSSTGVYNGSPCRLVQNAGVYGTHTERKAWVAVLDILNSTMLFVFEPIGESVCVPYKTIAAGNGRYIATVHFSHVLEFSQCVSSFEAIAECAVDL